jgi:hypothetical protein
MHGDGLDVKRKDTERVHASEHGAQHPIRFLVWLGRDERRRQTRSRELTVVSVVPRDR